MLLLIDVVEVLNWDAVCLRLVWNRVITDDHEVLPHAIFVAFSLHLKEESRRVEWGQELEWLPIIIFVWDKHEVFIVALFLLGSDQGIQKVFLFLV